jgi:hypothetical protein
LSAFTEEYSTTGFCINNLTPGANAQAVDEIDARAKRVAFMVLFMKMV